MGFSYTKTSVDKFFVLFKTTKKSETKGLRIQCKKVRIYALFFVLAHFAVFVHTLRHQFVC